MKGAKHMTNEQREKIKELRLQGMGYKAIANVVNLTRDSVRNFCKCNGLNGNSNLAARNIEEKIQNKVLCACCMKPLKQEARGRNKRFCNDKCRRKWWKEHQEARKLKTTAVYYFICVGCGNSFSTYGNKNRKYCSHDCYIKNRFWRGEESGISKVKS